MPSSRVGVVLRVPGILRLKFSGKYGFARIHLGPDRAIACVEAEKFEAIDRDVG
ncbi:MAG: hypothetical protein OXI05_09330 [Bacteroidota bacterium]|nr:hypothetical protein [Bacteroidota bacterium]